MPRTLPLLLVLLLISHAAAQQPESRQRWPGPDRAALQIPDSLWRIVLHGIGREGTGSTALGYSETEMSNYGGDRHLLRTVGRLFRNARTVPRLTGSTATAMVAAARTPASIVRGAYSLTDITGGRMLPLTDSTSWGVAWLSDSSTPGAWLDAIVRTGAGGASTSTVPTAEERKRWERMPLPLQRLVLRLYIGAVEAAPWLRLAFERCDPSPAELSRMSVDERYQLAAAPWIDERLGQSVSTNRRAFALMESIDREHLSFGSILLLTHVQRALAEWRAVAGSVEFGTAAPFLIQTPLGTIRLLGSGRDTVTTGAFLTIDPDGDDLYRGRQGVPLSLDQPISLVLDLDGNDNYDGTAEAITMGCGLFGLGAMIDLQGNDTWHARESALGCAWYGTGLVYDEAGDDRYTIDSVWGQGVAHIGAGVLIDVDGNDSYTCAQQSQGMGSTLGAGVLLDVAGNDNYLARDDGARSALYNGQSVAMSQGCGYGRRADLGDGHSLAGGVGVLVDGAGDDVYHATAWSQGCGYWWGLGMLEDLGGNDSYRNGKYSLGAAAHFAIGVQVDASGNDSYNVGNDSAVNQFQGHARDGSIGISIDGDGDDRYELRTMCGGAADLCSIALLWDRAGDDTYNVRFTPDTAQRGWTDRPPLGTASSYEPMRSFRDDLDAIGIFLDTGGSDSFVGYAIPGAGSDRSWTLNSNPRTWGFAWDGEWYVR